MRVYSLCVCHSVFKERFEVEAAKEKSEAELGELLPSWRVPEEIVHPTEEELKDVPMPTDEQVDAFALTDLGRGPGTHYLRTNLWRQIWWERNRDKVPGHALGGGPTGLEYQEERASLRGVTRIEVGTEPEITPCWVFGREPSTTSLGRLRGFKIPLLSRRLEYQSSVERHRQKYSLPSHQGIEPSITRATGMPPSCPRSCAGAAARAAVSSLPVASAPM